MLLCQPGTKSFHVVVADTDDGKVDRLLEKFIALHQTARAVPLKCEWHPALAGYTLKSSKCTVSLLNYWSGFFQQKEYLVKTVLGIRRLGFICAEAIRQRLRPACSSFPFLRMTPLQKNCSVRFLGPSRFHLLTMKDMK